MSVSSLHSFIIAFFLRRPVTFSAFFLRIPVTFSLFISNTTCHFERVSFFSEKIFTFSYLICNHWNLSVCVFARSLASAKIIRFWFNWYKNTLANFKSSLTRWNRKTVLSAKLVETTSVALGFRRASAHVRSSALMHDNHYINAIHTRRLTDPTVRHPNSWVSHQFIPYLTWPLFLLSSFSTSY